MDAVRRERQLDATPVPPLCILDFDGDLADGLARDGAAHPSRSWACFHTQMLTLTIDGLECGVVPRTIGGPYAVLIAAQLYAAGALAVEMQAASLFAFGTASGARIGMVALVSNSPATSDEQFDTGEHGYRLRVLSAIARAAHVFLDDVQ